MKGAAKVRSMLLLMLQVLFVIPFLWCRRILSVRLAKILTERSPTFG
jgi:hypothetical protein